MPIARANDFPRSGETDGIHRIYPVKRNCIFQTETSFYESKSTYFTLFFINPYPADPSKLSQHFDSADRARWSRHMPCLHVIASFWKSITSTMTSFSLSMIPAYTEIGSGTRRMRVPHVNEPQLAEIGWGLPNHSMRRILYTIQPGLYAGLMFGQHFFYRRLFLIIVWHWY